MKQFLSLNLMTVLNEKKFLNFIVLLRVQIIVFLMTEKDSFLWERF